MPKIGEKKILRHMDWGIIICMILLFGVGIICIINANAAPYAGEEAGFLQTLLSVDSSRVTRQLIFFVAGFVAVAVIMLLDYQTLKDYTGLFYWATMIIVFLLFGMGAVTKNTRSWYRIGSLGLQPSELVKVSLTMMLAKMLSERPAGEKIETIVDLIKPVFIVLLPFILVTVQGDLGTALVYFFIAMGMVLVAGISWKLVAMMGGVAAVVLPVAWFGFLEDYQKNRILAFINPELDPTGAGYNVRFSKIAIGSGQLTGRGMFSEGGLAQLNWVPEKETDFIFSVLAETFGFIGGMIVLLIYLVLIVRTLTIAMRTRDRYGSLVCVGISSMMMFHIFENVGMSMGIMPVTGIPLPFISYGGSNLLTNMIAYGVVLNIGVKGQRKT